MKKTKYFYLSQDVEVPILHFLWRVKVATTSALFFRFEKDFTWEAHTAYKRLSILKRKGCVDTKSDEAGNFKVWSLTLKGFRAIRHKLLALKEEGYASESIMHDLYVLAAHYGEWIRKGNVEDVLFVTEQELRRVDNAEFPIWLKGLQGHKPDGAWYFSEALDKKLIALEVELSRKRLNEYETLGVFYSEESSIHSVLWIVQSRGHANSMRRSFQVKTTAYRDIHNFVLIDDLKSLGWASQIFTGPDQGFTIHNFLESMRSTQSISKPSPVHLQGYVQKILDLRIKRFKSNTSDSNEKPENLCMTTLSSSKS